MGAPRYDLATVVALLQNAVLAKTQSIDVITPGGDVDTIITPPAQLGATLSNTLADASDIVTQSNPSALSESEALGVIGAEVRRLPAGVATTTLTAFTAPGPASSPPGTDITIYRGQAIGSVPDPATGQVLTAYASETTTLPAASAANYYSTVRGRFELPFPAIVIGDLTAQVRPGAFTQPLQALPAGFVGVTNLSTVSAAARRETVPEMIERWRVTLPGTSTTSPEGIERIVREAGVTDYAVLNSTSRLVTRPETGRGAPVDIFVRSAALESVVETLTFVGPGQLHILGTQPVVRIDGVVVGATTLTPTTHYTLQNDPSNLSGSIRARNGLVFTSAGETAIATALGGSLSVGANLIVTYSVSSVVRLLTTRLATRAIGVDALPRRGTEVPVYLAARVSAKANVVGGYATVAPLVRAALTAYVNALPMADGRLDLFDLQAAVGRLPSVDNFTITRLTTNPNGVGANNITFTLPQYLTLSAGNVSLSPG